MTWEDVLDKLPYDAARSGKDAGSDTTPDSRRYRDGREVYETVGLLFRGDDGRIGLTELGEATRRWLPIMTSKNSILFARHAAYALSACQLVNPIGAGKKYDPNVHVFPFQFIWRAMLALNDRISSDELNRAVFRVGDEYGLQESIERIRVARGRGDATVMGDEVITGERKNDRIVPWMSLASFGWILFPDKRAGGRTDYVIPSSTRSLLVEAAQIKHCHRPFTGVTEYVEYISRAAGLPRDLR